MGQREVLTVHAFFRPVMLKCDFIGFIPEPRTEANQLPYDHVMFVNP